MVVGELIRNFRKARRLSIREFAEILGVNKYRLEKWEKGIEPNYEDGIKLNKYFGIDDFRNLTEDFLKNFLAGNKNSHPEKGELIQMKDLLIAEKDKRIENLEQTISILKETLDRYDGRKVS